MALPTKIKEVIGLAFQNGTTFNPLLLTYGNEAMYLHIDPQGCALFSEVGLKPLYRVQEPLLLAKGIMTDSKTTHIVLLKASGDLCYTRISGPSTPQTTIISRLDVHATNYRQLFLFPQGKMIHIFYAYSHQTSPHLWRIEHRFWDGSSWQSVHLGEVFHPREPLYHVNLDSKGNIHLLSLSLQGQHTLLFTNRYNEMFHIWGSTTETLKIPGEVMNMTALLTSDDVHHLFWVVNSSNGRFELHSAIQTNALSLTSAWYPLPAPVEIFDSPSKNIGALEINGVLWLLVTAKEEILMKNDGNGWRIFSTHPPLHQPLHWAHKGERNSYQTAWLEDQVKQRTPAYYRELGLTNKRQVTSLSNITFQPAPPSPSPVPAFYPKTSSPSLYSQTLTTENKFDTLDSSETKEQEHEDAIKKVARIAQEKPNLSLTLHALLAKFDQILDVISDNVIQPQEIPSSAAPQEEPRQAQTIVETPFEEIKPLKEALSHLEEENQSLSQALRIMLTKQEESTSAIDKLELQICQLQVGKKDVTCKGGFWHKWFT